MSAAPMKGLSVVEGGQLQPEGKLTAKAAGLRYVSDGRPGIRREPDGGDGFRYLAADGSPVTEERTLERIRKLAIPPAYTDVWICPLANGHLQATGRDAKGRKQYRYHARWRAVRDETKYDRMLQFGAALPGIRERVEQDLSRPGLSREKVLAAVVRLLEGTCIRVGNEEYARQNESYGLTTLHNEHVEVEGSRLRFQFRGKSGKEHEVEFRDRRLARLLKRCQELPGQELFQYVDPDGERRSISSEDVNDYLREISGQEFTAKDFRTWNGTVLAFQELCACEECETEAEAKKNVVQAIRNVAERLGNTPTVCRKSYVHPSVLESYLDRATRPSMRECHVRLPRDGETGLRPEEFGALTFLRQTLSQGEKVLARAA